MSQQRAELSVSTISWGVYKALNAVHLLLYLLQSLISSVSTLLLRTARILFDPLHLPGSSSALSNLNNEAYSGCFRRSSSGLCHRGDLPGIRAKRSRGTVTHCRSRS